MKEKVKYVEPKGYFKDEWLKKAKLGKYSEEYKADLAKEREAAKEKANENIRDYVNGDK